MNYNHTAPLCVLYGNYYGISEEKPYYFQHKSDTQLLTKAHTHDFFELYILVRGRINHKVEEVEYEQSDGDVVLVFPGETHHIIDYSKTHELFSLSVHEAELERMMRAYGVYERLTNKRNRKIKIDVYKIEKLGLCGNKWLVFSKMNACDYFRIVIGTIIQAFLQSKMRDDNGWMTDIPVKMNNPENLAEGVAALMRITHLSHAQLCRTIKKQLNMTPQQYVKTLRMNCAFDKIQSTTEDCIDIAYSVGYSSFAHFSISFKEHFGMTPAELRKKSKLFML